MSDGWSKEELQAAVEAYIEMQRKDRAGQAFIKKHYYENLSAKFGRTQKAFEYRMQNISYVLSLMGRDWLSGLKPAKNVGANVAADIEALLDQVEGRKSVPVAAFEIAFREESKKKYLPKPIGNSSPKATKSEVTLFQRDTSVKAWVFQQAGGNCECCGKASPFNSNDGLPYLELHHVRQLADKGSDTTSNGVALCPTVIESCIMVKMPKLWQLTYMNPWADWFVNSLYNRLFNKISNSITLPVGVGQNPGFPLQKLQPSPFVFQVVQRKYSMGQERHSNRVKLRIYTGNGDGFVDQW